MNEYADSTFVCTVCGKSYGWDKKRERDWRQLRYCSTECAERRLSSIDYRLEERLIYLLDEAKAEEPVTALLAAMAVDPDGWRSLENASINAARRLAVRGKVELVRDGQVIDPDAAGSSEEVRRVVHPEREKALVN